MEHYTTSLQHILAELERIDLLIQVQVSRARQVHKTDEEFQGLYIPEKEINELLMKPAGLPQWATVPSPLSQSEAQKPFKQIVSNIEQRKVESKRQGIKLCLEELSCLFGLDSFDIDILLICLAPELDLRYERLYAYLQDDVTKKRPSVDLVLNLLCPSFESKIRSRQRFASESPLLKNHLLHLFDDPSHQNPPLLGKYIKVDERVVNYLLDSDELDNRLLHHTSYITPKTDLLDLLLPDNVKQRLTMLIQNNGANNNGLIFYFQGPYGVGKQSTAEALCNDFGIGLLKVNIDRLMKSEEIPFRTTLRLAGREALLREAALYLDGFDPLLADNRRNLLEELLQELEDRRGLTFLSGGTAWEPVDTLHELTFLRVEFPRPAHAERVRLWSKYLNGNTTALNEKEISMLSDKFRFSGGQIRDATSTARSLAHWRDPENVQMTISDLYQACRLQSNRKLAELAQKITPHYRWHDIVLPSDRMKQLREICNYVKYRSLVYDKWGFESKLSMGKGLNILFAGPSGTGKTMAADIIAGELGLDLYKIDLSTVVSKYIGETEKNLSHIFSEAATSNAILFFDEADALFGRRSEVRDSHDRYANIEISYLLQKMEEYDGVVILATNLRKNMDDAFVRRMHFTVEFPFPNEEKRLKIWEKIWPENTPRNQSLDLDFMANRFEIAGGNIRNIALAAAFMAADDGKVVNMDHLIHAIQREYQKMGKVVAEGEFGQYSRHGG